MFNVYVLKSLRNSKRYIGYSSKMVDVRLNEHNHRTSKWTRQNGPFKLIYQEEYKTKMEAIKREKFLKSGVGRSLLDSIESGGCSSIG